MSSYLIFTFSIGVIYFIFSLFLVQTVGKKYDTILVEKKIPLPISASSFIFPNSWGRANLYSFYILRNPSEKNGYGKLLNGFNFRIFASSSDIIISIAHIFLMLASFVTLIISFIN